MPKMRFQCPGCGVVLVKKDLLPNKSVRCPKCGEYFLPAAQGLPAKAPPAPPLPVAVPVAAAAPPKPRSRAWLVGCLALVFGGLLLLGMAGAGGAVYWFMRGQQVVSDPMAHRDGSTEPGKGPPATDPGTSPGDGKGPGPQPGDQPGTKPPPVPDPTTPGPAIELTLLDKGGADEPAPGPAAAGVLKALQGTVQRVAYAPDGTKLAAVYSHSENGEGKTRVVLWDLATQEPTQLLDQPGPGLVYFAADGKTLITGSREQAGIYDVATGAGKGTFPGELMAASADGRTLVTHLPRSRYAIYDVPSGKEVLNFEEQSGGYTVAVSPDGKLAAMDVKQEVRLFDVAAGKELPRFQASPSNNVGALFFADATLLLVGVGDASSGSIALWDIGDRGGQPQLRQRADEGGSYPSLSPDRKTLTLPKGDQLRMWDIPAWKFRASIPSCWVSVTVRGTFSWDGKTVAAYDDNYGVLVADATTGQVRKVVPGERTGNAGLAHKWSSFGLSPDSLVLALGTTEGAIHLRPVGGGGPAPAGVKELASVPFPPKTSDVGRDRNERAPLFTPDGRFVIVPARLLVDPSTSWDHLACDLTQRTFAAGFNGRSCWSLLDPRIVYTPDAYTEVFTDLATGKTRERKPEKPVLLYRRLLLSPDAKTLAANLTREATGKDEQIALVNPVNGQVLAGLLDKASASRFAFSPDGKFLAACVDIGAHNVKLWDLTRKAEVPTVAEHASDFLSFADNAKWLVTVDGDVLHAFDMSPAQTEKKVELARGHTGRVHAVACSPTAPLLATVGANGEALLRDLTTGEVRARLPGHTGDVTVVGFTPDGKRLVTAGEDNLLKLWEIGDLPPAGAPAPGPAVPAPTRPRPGRAFPFQPHEYAAFPCEPQGSRGYLRFSRDGNVVAIGYGKVQLWDMAAKTQRTPAAGKPELSSPCATAISCLAPDGRTVLHGGSDNLFAFDVSTGTLHPLPLGGSFYGQSAFSPDGKFVAVGQAVKGKEGKVLIVYDLTTYTEKLALTVFDGSVDGVGYTPDGADLFAFLTDRDGTRLLRLDPATLKQRADLGKVDSGFLVFSPDGKLVAFHGNQDPNSGKSDPSVIWDIAAGKVRTRVPRAGGEVSFFVPDAGLFVTASTGQVAASDVNTGQERLRLSPFNEMAKESGHERDSVYSPGSWDVAVSPDGHWLALGERGGSVYFWNLLRGKLVAKFKAHTGAVEGLAFSPDGRFLVTIGEEKKLKAWYLERLDSPPPAAPREPPAPAPQPAPAPPEAKPPTPPEAKPPTPPQPGPDPAESAIRTLTDPDKSARTKMLTLSRLNELKERAASAVPTLVKLLDDPAFDANDKEEIFGTLGMIGKPAVPALIDLAKGKVGGQDDRNADRAIRTLEFIGPDAKEAVPTILDVIKADPYQGGRYFGALNKIGGDPKEVVPVAVGQIKAARTLPRKQVGGGFVDAGVGDAFKTLAKAGPAAKEAVPFLISILQDKKGGYHVAAIETLGAIGPDAADALPVLRSMLSDAGIGTAAEKAIAKIKGSK